MSLARVLKETTPRNLLGFFFCSKQSLTCVQQFVNVLAFNIKYMYMWFLRSDASLQHLSLYFQEWEWSNMTLSDEAVCGYVVQLAHVHVYSYRLKKTEEWMICIRVSSVTTGIKIALILLLYGY